MSTRMTNDGHRSIPKAQPEQAQAKNQTTFIQETF